MISSCCDGQTFTLFVNCSQERVKIAEVSSTTDMSGLSQNLIDEKNEEIDHLSEQILRIQSDFSELKTEKGVENLVSTSSG